MTCPCGRKVIEMPSYRTWQTGVCYQCRRRHLNLPKHGPKLRLIQGGKK